MKRMRKRTRFWQFAVLVSLIVTAVCIFLAAEKRIITWVLPEPDYALLLARTVAEDIYTTGDIPAFVKRERTFNYGAFKKESKFRGIQPGEQNRAMRLSIVTLLAESVEIIIGENGESLTTIFYRPAQKVQEKGFERRLAPEGWGNEFGKVPRETAIAFYSNSFSIGSLKLERLGWKRPGDPVLGEFCKLVPTFTFVSGRRVAANRETSGFADKLRWKGTFRFRIVILLLWILPLALSLVICSFAFMEVSADYKQFCGQELSEMAVRLEKDFGVKHPLPSMWMFLRVTDIPELHRKTLTDLKRLRRELHRQIVVEAEQRARDKTVSAEAVVPSSSTSSGKNRPQRVQELIEELELLAPKASRSAEFKQSYGQALDLPEREKLRALGNLVQMLKRQLSQAEEPLAAAVKSSGSSVESREIKMDDLLPNLFPLEKIRSAVPWRVDARYVRAILITLLQPGREDARFDSHYRVHDEVKNVSSNHFWRLERQEFYPKQFETALSWMIRNGVLAVKPKTDELAIALTAKIGGKSAQAQKLISLGLIARDVIQHGVDV